MLDFLQMFFTDGMITLTVACIAGFIAIYQIRLNIILSARIKWAEDMKNYVSDYIERVYVSEGYYKLVMNDDNTPDSFYDKYVHEVFSSISYKHRILFLLTDGNPLHDSIKITLASLDNLMDRERGKEYEDEMDFYINSNLSSLRDNCKTAILNELAKSTDSILKRYWFRVNSILKFSKVWINWLYNFLLNRKNILDVRRDSIFRTVFLEARFNRKSYDIKMFVNSVFTDLAFLKLNTEQNIIIKRQFNEAYLAAIGLFNTEKSICNRDYNAVPLMQILLKSESELRRILTTNQRKQYEKFMFIEQFKKTKYKSLSIIPCFFSNDILKMYAKIGLITIDVEK